MNYLMTRNGENTFDTLFNDMFRDWGIRNSMVPSVDVYEDEKAFHVEAELAGYEEKDVNVHVEKHVLHISSEKKSERNENKKYIVSERSYAKFDRAFSLPESVDEDGIKAEFKNGILDVTLPKKPVEQPKRIQVKIN